MPIIALKDRPNYEGVLFGVPFHNSVSEFAVESSMFPKFNAIGYFFEVVPDDFKQETQIANLKAKLEAVQIQFEKSKLAIIAVEEKLAQSQKAFADLYDVYNQSKAENERLESRLKAEIGFAERAKQTRGK